MQRGFSYMLRCLKTSFSFRRYVHDENAGCIIIVCVCIYAHEVGEKVTLSALMSKLIKR